jgi:hypothetical protein
MERRIDHDAITAYTQRAVFLLRRHRQERVWDLPEEAREDLDDLSQELWPDLEEWQIILSENPPPSDPEQLHQFTREWAERITPELHAAMSSLTAAQRIAEEMVSRS